jgi:FkbM family methyltransferase
MSSRSRYLAQAERFQLYAHAAYGSPTSYAQWAEDLILLRALNTVDRGFYIDVGAWDEVQDSVTKLFYEKGWSGINIEPCPRWFSTLVAPRSRDINLRLAASDHTGVVTLHEIPETGLSTIVAKYADQYLAQGLPHRAYPVPCRPLRDICDEYVHGDIHFLKIDVEGAEKSVLQGCDFNRFRPWLLVIEATVPNTQTPCHAEWEDLVLRTGYEFALFHGVNRYYVARERQGLKAIIQQPESSLLSVRGRKIRSLKPVTPLGEASEASSHKSFSEPPSHPLRPLSACQIEAGLTGQPSSRALPEKPEVKSRPCATTILAYVIALAGLVIIAGGTWELNTDSREMLRVSIALTGIMMIAGGFGLIGLAQALRLLLELNANR